MDRFLEEVVERKKGKTLAKVMYVISWIVIVLSALIASTTLMTLFTSFSIWALVQTVLTAGIAFLFFRQKDNVRSIELEYTFTNGEMDFARVMGNVRRKHLLSLSLRDVEAAGRVSNNSFQRYASMRDIKRHDFFLNNSSNLAYLFFVKEGTKQLIVFEPSDAMCEMITNINPRVLQFA